MGKALPYLALTMLSMLAPAAPNMNPPNKTEKNTVITVPPETHGELPAVKPSPAARYPHPQFGFGRGVCNNV